MPKYLFVCLANANRSPTFEKWFRINRPQYNVRSSGIWHGYPHQVSKELLDWADVIYVMDLSQEIFIFHWHPEYHEKVEVIGVSDQYDRDEPELIQIIEYWVKKKGL